MVTACIDLLELVTFAAAFCLCGSEELAAKPRRRLIAIFFIGNFILEFVELCLEGASLNEVTSPIADLPNGTTTMVMATSFDTSIFRIFLYGTVSNNQTTQMWQPDIGVEDGIGLILWKSGFITLVCIILPLKFLQLTNVLVGRKGWGKFPPNETRDPYCLCFNIDDNREDYGANENCCTPGFCTRDICCGYIFLKSVAIKLFALFESIVRVIISSGRFLFFTTSSTNLMFAFGDFTFVSGVMLLVDDSLSFIGSSVSFYFIIPCCSNRVCTRYSVFTILSFYVSAAALYCSGFNFLMFSFGVLNASDYDKFDRDKVFFAFGIELPCFLIISMIIPTFICCICKVFKKAKCKR